MNKYCAILLLATLTACTSNTTNTTDGNAQIIAKYNQKMTTCDNQTFKSATAKTRCMNDADSDLIPYVGADADLIHYQMKKRIEYAQMIDNGQLSRTQANDKIKLVYAEVAAKSQQRHSQRLATILPIIAASNQTAALNSIAHSQARMATAMEVRNNRYLYP